MQQKQSELLNKVNKKLYIKTAFRDKALVYSNNPRLFK
jgi:hypothetical protein